MGQPNRTKIVATVGPACASEAKLRELVVAGVDVFRINAAHSKPQGIAHLIRRIRRVDRRLKRGIGVLVDLQGPKIRVGPFKDAKPIWLRAGQALVISTESGVVGQEVEPGSVTRIGTSYKHLSRDVRPNERVLLDDGYIELKVVEVAGTEVHTEVVYGGLLKQHKGINLPGSKVSTKTLTKKDLLDLEAALDNGADFIALSFVRSASDMRRLRGVVAKHGADTRLIAKIERPEAIQNLAEIIAEADALMIARGDMGVEMGPEVVPVLQKRIIREAVAARRPVITATQMLESMVTNPRPTRAEASDVANAIYDGTSAVMLSAETATGDHPVRSTQIMDRIIKQAEKDMFASRELVRRRRGVEQVSVTIATVRAAVHAALDAGAKVIAVFSESGATAEIVAAERSPTRVVAFTPFQPTVRRLSLVWGVSALRVSRTRTAHEMTLEGERVLVERGIAKIGDRVVVVVGSSRKRGLTNIMNIRTLGEES